MSARLLATRLALACSLALCAAPAVARAQDDEDEAGEDGGDEGEEEEEDEEGDGEEGDEAEAKDAADQPPVTAGGLFTKKTYPVAENERPLTLIQGMFEVQLGANVDISALGAFESVFGVLKARYGIADHFELQFGSTTLLAGATGGAIGNNKGRIDIGIEPAIVYDLVDMRITLEMPIQQENAEPFLVDIALGFPFRYRPDKRVALIALDRLMTIHTSGGKKPDLTAGVGAILQPAPIVAVLLRAEITIPDFNTNFVKVPASAGVQLSPDNRFDLGLEFTFANVKQPDESLLGPFDQRFVLMYLNARF